MASAGPTFIVYHKNNRRLELQQSMKTRSVQTAEFNNHPQAPGSTFISYISHTCEAANGVATHVTLMLR